LSEAAAEAFYTKCPNIAKLIGKISSMADEVK